MSRGRPGAWAPAVYPVTAGPMLKPLQAGAFAVHYRWYATCWKLLVSATVGAVALWPVEIALRWMTGPRAPLTLKVLR